VPFAALIAVQLVVVMLAPSRPTVSASTLGGASPSFGSGSSTGVATGGAAGASGSGSGLPGVGGSAGGAGSGSGVGGAAGSGTGTAAGGGAAGGSGAGGSGASGGGTTGTSGGHFCVSGLLEHPPCVAKWAGGSNGGATSPGVSGTSVTVVMYRDQENAAVNAITQATGTYISPQSESQMLGVVQKFINTHYQLYGRQIHFVYYHGNCPYAPANDSCFRSEADKIAATYHPFALFWDNDATEGAFMDELARKGVITWGGWGFSDAFDQSLRPYHYDLFMSGDVQAEFAGEYWCNQLANQKASYAGGSLKLQTRKVAVSYPDTPEVAPAAHHLESIIKGCDHNGAFDAPYSADTSTAASQATALTAKEKSGGVTSIIWLTDPVAPAYGTNAQNAQNYQPEEILAGGGLVDYDSLAQTYNTNVWKHAFGLSDLAAATPIDGVDAGKVWQAEHMSGSPNAAANLMTSYALSLAGGIEAAGPDLTPLHYEAGMLTTPGYDAWTQYHDPRLVYIKYGSGDYTGESDVRVVYWDPNRRSPINGKAGTYVPMNGGARYQLGQIPHTPIKFPSTV
jgi:hypothetical protein